MTISRTTLGVDEKVAGGPKINSFVAESLRCGESHLVGGIELGIVIGSCDSEL
jgi:hypothetical protein